MSRQVIVRERGAPWGVRRWRMSDGENTIQRRACVAFNAVLERWSQYLRLSVHDRDDHGQDDAHNTCESTSLLDIPLPSVLCEQPSSVLPREWVGLFMEM